MKIKICLLVATLFFAATAQTAPVDAVDGQTQFATDLYKLIAAKPGNIIFSPYSIANALAMTASGADKMTLDEMKKTLHLSDNFISDYKDLISAVKPSGD